MSPNDLLSASGALVLVVGLILLLRYGTRLVRPRLPGGTTRLAVTAQLGLDNKRRLQLVECDGVRILLLTGGGSDVMLPCPAGVAGDRP